MMAGMQQSVLFDIAETPFRWWFFWPAAILLLALIFPLLAYLLLGENLQGKQRRNFTLACGGVAAAIIILWLLFVGPPTISEYLRYRQMRADRNSNSLVEIEGVFLFGMSGSTEMGGDAVPSTFVVRDDQSVRYTFTAHLTESVRFYDLQPFVSQGDRLRVSYVPRSNAKVNNALRVVVVAKSAR